MHMGRKLTVLWNERELGNSVILFTCFCCRAVLPNVPYQLNAQFGHLVWQRSIYIWSLRFWASKVPSGKPRLVFLPLAFFQNFLSFNLSIQHLEDRKARSVHIYYTVVTSFEFSNCV